jgi:hypothetical protein
MAQLFVHEGRGDLPDRDLEISSLHEVAIGAVLARYGTERLSHAEPSPTGLPARGTLRLGINVSLGAQHMSAGQSPHRITGYRRGSRGWRRYSLMLICLDAVSAFLEDAQIGMRNLAGDQFGELRWADPVESSPNNQSRRGDVGQLIGYGHTSVGSRRIPG